MKAVARPSVPPLTFIPLPNLQRSPALFVEPSTPLLYIAIRFELSWFILKLRAFIRITFPRKINFEKKKKKERIAPLFPLLTPSIDF